LVASITYLLPGGASLSTAAMQRVRMRMRSGPVPLNQYPPGFFERGSRWRDCCPEVLHRGWFLAVIVAWTIDQKQFWNRSESD
jgi:hypothetical protein